MRKSIEKIIRFSILLLLSSVQLLKAQPGNPIFSLSTEVSLDIDIRSIAIMDVESSGVTTDFTFSLPVPSEAGVALGSNPLLTNDEIWINYSSANRDITSRHISVNIAAGSIPESLELKLDVAACSGMSGGTTGMPVPGSIILSEAAQNIITGIEGSYTGDGAFNGHQLTYSLHYTSADFENLTIGDQNIIIAFTLVDD